MSNIIGKPIANYISNIYFNIFARKFRGTFLLNEHTGEVFAMLFQVIEEVSIFDNVVEIFI